jgi:hypothetical protein
MLKKLTHPDAVDVPFRTSPAAVQRRCSHMQQRAAVLQQPA